MYVSYLLLMNRNKKVISYFLPTTVDLKYIKRYFKHARIKGTNKGDILMLRVFSKDGKLF